MEFIGHRISGRCNIILLAIISILAPVSGAKGSKPVRKLIAPPAQHGYVKMSTRHLVLNGQERGCLLVRETEQNGEKVVMVPLRTMVEILGWKVVVQQLPEYGQKDRLTPHVSVTAPYRYQDREEMRPSERDLKPSPGFSLSLDTGDTRLFSPEWSMDETLEAKPLPVMVDGQVYVSLGFLDEAMMRLVGRLVETMSQGGEDDADTDGIQMEYKPAEARIYVRYKEPRRAGTL